MGDLIGSFRTVPNSDQLQTWMGGACEVDFFFSFFVLVAEGGARAESVVVCCCWGQAELLGSVKSTAEDQDFGPYLSKEVLPQETHRWVLVFSQLLFVFCARQVGFAWPGVVPICVSPSNQWLSNGFTWEERCRGGSAKLLANINRFWAPKLVVWWRWTLCKCARRLSCINTCLLYRGSTLSWVCLTSGTG